MGVESNRSWLVDSEVGDILVLVLDLVFYKVMVRNIVVTLCLYCVLLLVGTLLLLVLIYYILVNSFCLILN